MNGEVPVPGGQIVNEEVLRQSAAFANPRIEFIGSTVVVIFLHPLFTAGGHLSSRALIVFEGQRRFGKLVSFADPLQVSIRGVTCEEDQEYAVNLVLNTLEVLVEASSNQLWLKK